MAPILDFGSDSRHYFSRFCQNLISLGHFGQIIEISEIPSQYGGNFVYSPGYITGFKPFYSADALKYTELEKPGVNELHVAEHGDADFEDTRGCDGLKGD